MRILLPLYFIHEIKLDIDIEVNYMYAPRLILNLIFIEKWTIIVKICDTCVSSILVRTPFRKIYSFPSNQFYNILPYSCQHRVPNKLDALLATLLNVY
jgi:hypothetical protein